jgi:transcriptional regulator with XRE-family HTH domain
MNSSILYLKIGRALRLVRESRNLKQEHVAEKLGYADKSTYAKMEAGKIKHIGIDKLNDVCSALDCSMIHLLLLAATTQFSYQINTWEEFLDSVTGLPKEEKERMVKLVREIFPEKQLFPDQSFNNNLK